VDRTSVPLVVESDGEPGVFKLIGELDLATAPGLEARVEGVDGAVELECSGLTFVDSNGLRVLLAIHTACRARGAKLTILNPSSRVTQLLELTKLDAELDLRWDGTSP
jgi:anti-anti-sigma factor